jgi:hypothetical protein
MAPPITDRDVPNMATRQISQIRSGKLGPMSALARDIAQLRLGQHACLFYDNRAEQVAVTAAFLAAGLRRRERCFCVIDPRYAGDLRDTLRSLGVAVERAEAANKLVFQTDAIYFSGGRFDPEHMIGLLGREVQSALDDGFRGFRAAGEMTWALGKTVDVEALFAYEAMMNQFYERNAAAGLCLYSLNEFPAHAIARVLHTHPEAVYQERLCRNHFYEPPDVTLASDPSRARADWMLGQLQPVTTFGPVRKPAKARARVSHRTLRKTGT